MGRLGHMVKLGQQGQVPTHVSSNHQGHMCKLPDYVAPLPSPAPRLSTEEGDKQLGQFLARWQPWAASWPRLVESTLDRCRYCAQNPERLLRLECLLDQGLQEGCSVCVATR